MSDNDSREKIVMNRREVVSLAAAGIAAGVLASIPYANAAHHALKSEIKALAFDGFPVFDPGPFSRWRRNCFRAGALI